jgi:hypothetical protein
MNAMAKDPAPTRAELFTYAGLDVSADSLVAHYDLDGRKFSEAVTFEGAGDLTDPAATAVAELWYLVAGLSYYKAGAARRVDLAASAVGPRGRALFEAALRDGLGEFSYRNDLALDEVTIEGGLDARDQSASLDTGQVLTPFGGGIDSVVTSEQLKDRVTQSLFIVSPASGTFVPLEATAAVTGLPIVRATRTLDPQILNGSENFFRGHVPVTAMIALLAATAAVSSGQGGVAMSNEFSASSPNVRWRGRDINHQWSKSLVAEQLLGDALAEAVGGELAVASYLRDRSELWVADVFSELTPYHHVFRSCNRAFAQSSDRRATEWCGRCDKCLFVNLVLAPFLSRATLREIFSAEPLSDPARTEQLRVLVGLGKHHKPFECVGDPDESAVALTRVSEMPEWSDVEHLAEISSLTTAHRDFGELLSVQGPSRVPAHWLQ